MVWLLPGGMVPEGNPETSGIARAAPLWSQKFTEYCAGLVSVFTRMMVVFHPPPSAMCEIVFVAGGCGVTASMEVNAWLFTARIPRAKIGTLGESNSITPLIPVVAFSGVGPNCRCECRANDRDVIAVEPSIVMGIAWPCSSRIVMVICASALVLELAIATPKPKWLSNGRNSLEPPAESSGTAAS